jgi:hypothetical protein
VATVALFLRIRTVRFEDGGVFAWLIRDEHKVAYEYVVRRIAVYRRLIELIRGFGIRRGRIGLTVDIQPDSVRSPRAEPVFVL